MEERKNHILYLHEYKNAPDEIVKWKDDENLLSLNARTVDGAIPTLMCVGIGRYKTSRDGEIFLCVLIDPSNSSIVSYSIGVYRSAELVGKALELLEHDSAQITLRSSRNPLYCSKIYQEILEQYGINAEYTMPGTKGMVASVSTFFSQLMRKKDGYEFVTWQDAVNWIENYVRRRGKI